MTTTENVSTQDDLNNVTAGDLLCWAKTEAVGLVVSEWIEGVVIHVEDETTAVGTSRWARTWVGPDADNFILVCLSTTKGDPLRAHLHTVAADTEERRAKLIRGLALCCQEAHAGRNRALQRVRALTDERGTLADQHRLTVNRLQERLTAAQDADAAVVEYKRTVRRVAFEVAQERDFCADGLNGYLSELGLEAYDSDNKREAGMTVKIITSVDVVVRGTDSKETVRSWVKGALSARIHSSDSDVTFDNGEDEYDAVIEIELPDHEQITWSGGDPDAVAAGYER